MPSPSDNPLQWAGPKNEQFAREFNKCVTADLLKSNWITEDEALHRIAKTMPWPSDNPLHEHNTAYPKAPFRPGVGTFFRVGFAAIAYVAKAAALKLRGKAIPKD
jgi:hypothetical protein